MMTKLKVLVVACVTLVLHARPPAAAQTRILKMPLVGSRVTTEQDDALRSLFRQILTDIPALPFDQVDFINFTYGSSCSAIHDRTIGTLTPLKFVQCQSELGNSLRPLLIVRKREPTPYYSGLFVANRNSSIRSLDSPAIKRLILVHPNSTSGYMAPLYKLAETHVLREPTESGAEAKGWEVVVADSHREAVARLETDNNAMAGVGDIQDDGAMDESRFRILLRYSLFPQDPVIISSDLAPYETQIAEWFAGMLSSSATQSIFAESSTQITGVQPFEDEHRNAYAELERVRRAVRAEVPFLTVEALKDVTIRDLLALAGKLRVSTAATLIGVLVGWCVSLAGVAYKLGKRTSTAVSVAAGSPAADGNVR